LLIAAIPLEEFKVEHEKGGKMSVHLQIEETPDYLFAKAAGAGNLGEAERLFESLAEHCARANKNKLLLDCNGVTTEFSLADIFSLGEKARVFALFRCKVAVVCKPEQYDSESFLETTARNRWVNLRVFTNIEDAREWLLK
jgi:hypothetical protein